jgi:very-short-patch-repair endonuclease
MLWMLRVEGLLPVKTEYRFMPTRRFRFDFCWPERKVALEVEGGRWVNGAHSRPQHFESDCEKYSEAAILGYRVIRVTEAMVHDGRAVNLVRRALSRKSAEVSVPDVEC